MNVIPATVEPAGWRIHRVLRTDSTNQRLMEAIGSGAELDVPWTVLVAHEQMAGRGRSDRAWHCPAGQGLLCSLRLDLDLRCHALPLLGHWLALVVAQCLNLRLETAGSGFRAVWKWPNDILLVNGARLGKVAGILIQTQIQGARARAVLGLGVNLSQLAFPEGLRQPALSMAMAGVVLSDEVLLQQVLAALSARGLPEHPTDLLQDLRGLDLLALLPVRIQSPEGVKRLSGWRHLEDGRLELAWEGGSTLLAGGGLRLSGIRNEELWCQVEM